MMRLKARWKLARKSSRARKASKVCLSMTGDFQLNIEPSGSGKMTWMLSRSQQHVTVSALVKVSSQMSNVLVVTILQVFVVVAQNIIQSSSSEILSSDLWVKELHQKGLFSAALRTFRRHPPTNCRDDETVLRMALLSRTYQFLTAGKIVGGRQSG